MNTGNLRRKISSVIISIILVAISFNYLLAQDQKMIVKEKAKNTYEKIEVIEIDQKRLIPNKIRGNLTDKIDLKNDIKMESLKEITSLEIIGAPTLEKE